MQVTEAAAAVIHSIREQVGAPEDATLRLQRAESEEGETTLGLSFTQGPLPGDGTIEQSGVTVCIEPELQQVLDEAVLDAQSTPEGAQLVVRA